jgi:hypothetical protein
VERSDTVGASTSGLLVKMGLAPVRVGEDKKIFMCRVRVGEGKGSIVKLYSCFLARARGLLNNILFFCLIIGFKEFKLYNS